MADPVATMTVSGLADLEEALLELGSSVAGTALYNALMQAAIPIQDTAIAMAPQAAKPRYRYKRRGKKARGKAVDGQSASSTTSERVLEQPGNLRKNIARKRLKGRKFILTNAPQAYALRVLGQLGIAHLFDGLISIEQMHMFGDLRPKPDARMLRHFVEAVARDDHRRLRGAFGEQVEEDVPRLGVEVGGGERAQLALLSDKPGWFHRLRKDFGLPGFVRINFGCPPARLEAALALGSDTRLSDALAHATALERELTDTKAQLATMISGERNAAIIANALAASSDKITALQDELEATRKKLADAQAGSSADEAIRKHVDELTQALADAQARQQSGDIDAHVAETDQHQRDDEHRLDRRVHQTDGRHRRHVGAGFFLQDVLVPDRQHAETADRDLNQRHDRRQGTEDLQGPFVLLENVDQRQQNPEKQNPRLQAVEAGDGKWATYGTSSTNLVDGVDDGLWHVYLVEVDACSAAGGPSD